MAQGPATSYVQLNSGPVSAYATGVSEVVKGLQGFRDREVENAKIQREIDRYEKEQERQKILDDRAKEKYDKEVKTDKLLADMMVAEEKSKLAIAAAKDMYSPTESDWVVTGKDKLGNATYSVSGDFVNRMTAQVNKDMSDDIYSGARGFLSKADTAGVSPSAYMAYVQGLNTADKAEEKDKLDYLRDQKKTEEARAFQKELKDIDFKQQKELKKIEHGYDVSLKNLTAKNESKAKAPTEHETKVALLAGADIKKSWDKASPEIKDTWIKKYGSNAFTAFSSDPRVLVPATAKATKQILKIGEYDSSKDSSTSKKYTYVDDIIDKADIGTFDSERLNRYVTSARKANWSEADIEDAARASIARGVLGDTFDGDIFNRYLNDKADQIKNKK